MSDLSSFDVFFHDYIAKLANAQKFVRFIHIDNYDSLPPIDPQNMWACIDEIPYNGGSGIRRIYGEIQSYYN